MQTENDSNEDNHPFLKGLTVSISSGINSSSSVFSLFDFFLAMGAFNLLSNIDVALLSAAKMLSLPLTFLFSDILLLLMVSTLNSSSSSKEFLKSLMKDLKF